MQSIASATRVTLTNPDIWSKQGPRAPDISLQNSMDLPSLTRGDLQGSICKVLANVLVQSWVEIASLRTILKYSKKQEMTLVLTCADLDSLGHVKSML